MSKDKLTLKQELFINYILEGLSQRAAYKKAFNAKYKDEVIDVRACELFNQSKVQVRYKQLVEKSLEQSIMTSKERMKWLSDVIGGKIKEKETVIQDGEIKIKEVETNINTKVKALDTLNKMTGEYIQKVEIDNSNLEVIIKVIE